jgi:addiction module HigA family antidote
MMSSNTLLAGLGPTHPGEILREDILPALALTKTAFAKRLGVSRQTLYDILEGRQPVTPAMALRLGKLLGNTPEFWLNLQRDYDLRVIGFRMREELAAIEPIEAA